MKVISMWRNHGYLFLLDDELEAQRLQNPGIAGYETGRYPCREEKLIEKPNILRTASS
jgi:hypothetical protein